MDKKSNVINFGNYWVQNANSSELLEDIDPNNVGQIVELKEFTEKKVEFDRRRVRRTILSEFLGAFIVIPQVGLQEVTLYDVSDGLSFDVDIKVGQFKIGSSMAMRFYLSQSNYFSFDAQITNVRLLPEEGVYRHGAKIMRNANNGDAIEYFMKFIESVSRIVKTDKGDLRAPGARR